MFNKILIVIAVFFFSSICEANEKIDRMLRPFVSVEGASGSVIRSWRDENGDCWSYVLTAEHVIREAEKYKAKVRENTGGIELNEEFFFTTAFFPVFNSKGNEIGGEKYYGKVEISNREVDYAICSFQTPSVWPTVKVSSAGNLALFDRVYSVGCPNGYRPWVTEGILSEFRHKPTNLGHSAKIYYGSSGGPLFNEKFEQIGVNVRIATDNREIPIEHIAFAVSLYRIQNSLGTKLTRKYFGYVGNH